MSEQETMRLVAEVVNKYSGPLKDMQRDMKALADFGKKSNEAGAKQATEHGRAYNVLREQIVRLKTQGIDVATPAIAEMGIGMTSLAGAVAAAGAIVVKSGLDWASWGRTLTLAHRASGLQIDTLRGLAEANARWGASQEETIQSLETFGQHMDQQARRSYSWMNAYKQFPTLWNQLGKSLDGFKTREEQLRRVMEYIPTIKSSDQRARVLEFFGLPENWRDLTTQEMQEMERISKQWQQEHPFDAKKAAETKAAWEEVRATFRGLTSDLGNLVGPALKHNIDDMKNMAEDIAKIFKTIMTPGGADKWWNKPLFGDKDSLADQLSKKEPRTDDKKPNWMSWWGKPVFGGADDKKAKESVKEGVKEGLEDFYHSLQDTNKQGGYTPMAFHPGGEGGGRSTPRFGSKEFPNLGGGGAAGTGGGGSIPKSMGKSSSGASVPGGSGSDASINSGGGSFGMSSDSLAKQRERFAQELQQNPALKEKVFQLSAGEDRPSKGQSLQANQAVMESMMNRAIVRGTTLEKQAKWYGREAGGYYAGKPSHLSEHERKMSEENLARVLSGGNVSNYATDNSSQGLAAREKASGKFRFKSEYHGESFFSPGWGEPGLEKKYGQWRDMMQAKEAHGAKLRDMATRGRRPPADADLLRRGMRAVDSGGDLNSNAHLTVDLNGFPKGTKTGLKSDGFKQVTLNRGRPMVVSSETS